MDELEKKEKYDLSERTSAFGEKVILFAKKIPESTITRPLISQLIRATTSIGANYQEADNAESRADFKHKISICKKEAKETTHWFRMISIAVPSLKEEGEPLRKESIELTLIFNAIYNTTTKKALVN